MSKFGKKQIKIVSEIMRVDPHIKEAKLMLTTYKQNYTIQDLAVGPGPITALSSQSRQPHFETQKLTISGPLGTQSIFIPNLFEVKIDNENPLATALFITPRDLDNCLLTKVGSGFRSHMKSGYITETKNKVIKKRNQLWGTLWSQINKMIKGVTVGFKRQIKLTGIGFKATLTQTGDKNLSQILSLNLGYSHPILFNIPSIITVSFATTGSQNQGTLLELTSSDEIELSKFAHMIKKVRPADKSYGKATAQNDKGQTGITVINI